MTEKLFEADNYLKSCEATVYHSDEDGIVLDRTVFYPMGGGQQGDTGQFLTSEGNKIIIKDTRYHPESGKIIHIPEEETIRLAEGTIITAEIDWARRYALMRMHSCLHLLCSLVPAGVTGGQITAERGRLDFDMQEPLDKQALTAALNRLINADHSRSIRWITDEELDQQPELVRTLSVQPPRGTGRVRLVDFKDIDLQPCGGTHVANTAEIGVVQVAKIEKKGKRNRRVSVVFAE